MVEVAIASAMLLAVLGIAMGSFLSTQRTASFSTGRHASLDELRLTADAFAREARQAERVVEALPHRLVMETYVDGVRTTATWEVVAGPGGAAALERRSPGRRSFHVVELAETSPFAYDATDPSAVRRIRLFLAARTPGHARTVELFTEVSLRNA